MEGKYLQAALLLVMATLGASIASCASKRVRDVLFFLMVTLSTLTEAWDVNFVSREWYRGTTCGFEVSVVDVFAISLVIGSFLFPRRGEKRLIWPASLGLMILYLLFNVFCVAVSDPKLFGYFAISKLLRGILIFGATVMYVRGERELKLFLFALGMIVCYEGFQAVEQRYRWGIHRVFADLNAPNSLSMYFCTTAPVFAAALASRLPRYLKALCGVAVAFACIGVILTVSRAGVVVLGLVLVGTAAFTVSMKMTPRKLFLAAAIALAATGMLAKSWNSLTARFHEASLEDEMESKQGRGYYLRVAGAIIRDHPLGIGPNNWSYWVSNKYGPELGYKFAPYPGTDHVPKFQVAADANVDDPQAAPAHSLGALTVGETGFIGLFFFSILWLRWFQMGSSFLWRRTPDPMRRIGIGIFFGTWGMFLQSLTEWVYHQTALYFTFHIMLGVLASLYWLKKRARRLEREQAALEEEGNWDSEPAPATA